MDAKPYVMKISLATVNDQLHAFAKDYAAAVEKDSGGRIKGEIYPASQLGIDAAPGRGRAVWPNSMSNRSAGIFGGH
ncbi:MAG: hypothetical protein WBD71_01030 [Xanthobacteraceae bacterium]